MKKILSAAVVLLLLLGLGACGTGDAKNPAGGTQENDKKLPEGIWRVYVVASEHQMEELTLSFDENGEGEFNVNVYGKESFMVDAGKVELNGTVWYEEGFGYGSDTMTYEEKGNTVTVEIDGRGQQGTIVLERTAGNQLKVTKVTGTIIDEQITGETKVGTVYTWAG